MPAQKLCPVYGFSSGGFLPVLAGYDCVDVNNDLEYDHIALTAFSPSAYTITFSDLVVDV